MKEEKNKTKFSDERAKFFAAMTAAVLVVGFICFAVYAADKQLDKAAEASEERQAQAEATKQKQLELVSIELGIPTKKILYKSRTFLDYETFKYQTDNGIYLVQFEGEQIKTIVKEEEED